MNFDIEYIDGKTRIHCMGKVLTFNRMLDIKKVISDIDNNIVGVGSCYVDQSEFAIVFINERIVYKFGKDVRNKSDHHSQFLDILNTSVGFFVCGFTNSTISSAYGGLIARITDGRIVAASWHSAGLYTCFRELRRYNNDIIAIGSYYSNDEYKGDNLAVIYDIVLNIHYRSFEYTTHPRPPRGIVSGDDPCYRIGD